MAESGMKHGMLWYDSHMGADVAAHITRALDYFTAKYGRPPACCYIHPEMLGADFPMLTSIRIVPSERVLRNHIWIEFPLAD